MLRPLLLLQLLLRLLLILLHLLLLLLDSGPALALTSEFKQISIDEKDLEGISRSVFFLIRAGGVKKWTRLGACTACEKWRSEPWMVPNRESPRIIIGAQGWEYRPLTRKPSLKRPFRRV